MRLAKYHGMHLRPSHQYHQLYLSVCQPISPELTEYWIVGTKQDQQNNLLMCVPWMSLLLFKHYQIILNTRMRSCRMHTVRFSGHLGGEEGGVCLGGVCLGMCTPTHPLRTHCIMTDRCKNITFPQLRLRAVIRNKWEHIPFLDVSPYSCMHIHQHPVK